jgi:hypothetical protein
LCKGSFRDLGLVPARLQVIELRNIEIVAPLLRD